MPDIKEARILIMATDGFEQSELSEPMTRLKQDGATVHLATPGGQPIRGWNKSDWGATVDADLAIADVEIEAYSALVLPGGQINPDLLRVNEDAVRVVRNFVAANKIVAAICHAPWLLIEAGVVSGREMTGYASVRTDLKNAGAEVVDQEVAISNGIITSRHPGDLDAFIGKIREEIAEGEHERPVAPV